MPGSATAGRHSRPPLGAATRAQHARPDRSSSRERRLSTADFKAWSVLISYITRYEKRAAARLYKQRAGAMPGFYCRPWRRPQPPTLPKVHARSHCNTALCRCRRSVPRCHRQGVHACRAGGRGPGLGGRQRNVLSRPRRPCRARRPCRPIHCSQLLLHVECQDGALHPRCKGLGRQAVGHLRLVGGSKGRAASEGDAHGSSGLRSTRKCCGSPSDKGHGSHPARSSQPAPLHSAPQRVPAASCPPHLRAVDRLGRARCADPPVRQFPVLDLAVPPAVVHCLAGCAGLVLAVLLLVCAAPAAAAAPGGPVGRWVGGTRIAHAAASTGVVPSTSGGAAGAARWVRNTVQQRHTRRHTGGTAGRRLPQSSRLAQSRVQAAGRWQERCTRPLRRSPPAKKKRKIRGISRREVVRWAPSQPDTLWRCHL